MAGDRTITLNSKINKAPDLLAAEMDGEIVLLNVEQGSYYGLDAVGSDIWQRLEAPIVISDLASQLARDYDGDVETIESDLLALAAELHAEGLVTVSV